MPLPLIGTGRALLAGRQQSAFVPTDIAGLEIDLESVSGKLWQDAARTTPAGVGDPVGGWTEQSGNARHASQSTAAKRFTVESVTNNGVTFWAAVSDGVDDVLTGTPPTGFVNSTTILVVNLKVIVTNEGVFSFASGANNDWNHEDGLAIHHTTSPNALIGLRHVGADVLDCKIAVTQGEWNIFVLRRNSGSAQLYRNGGTPVTDTYSDLNPLDPTQYVLGARLPLLLYGHNSFARTLFYSRALTDGEVNQLLSHLSPRHGITVTLL